MELLMARLKTFVKVFSKLTLHPLMTRIMSAIPYLGRKGTVRSRLMKEKNE